MKNAAPLPILLSLVLALPACARSDGAYPSLAQRPAELRGFAEPEAPPAPPVATDPVLDARVTEARRSLATVVAGFDRDVATARTAGARAGARTKGSDAWLDAQTALAGLDDWRAQASSIATDADALASTRASALLPPYPAVETLRRDASAEVNRQDAAIRQFAASLPGG